MHAGNTMAGPPSEAQIREWLTEVTDPEIPVLTIEDLGILRDISATDDGVTVRITPTYSGCPAMMAIRMEIVRALNQRGLARVRVEEVLSPAWTTDWMSDAGREKLRAYGIAPPVGAAKGKSALFGEPDAVACPQCGSERTSRTSEFGSTACKAMYRCDDCLEPFDYFKCI